MKPREDCRVLGNGVEVGMGTRGISRIGNESKVSRIRRTPNSRLWPLTTVLILCFLLAIPLISQVVANESSISSSSISSISPSPSLIPSNPEESISETLSTSLASLSEPATTTSSTTSITTPVSSSKSLSSSATTPAKSMSTSAPDVFWRFFERSERKLELNGTNVTASSSPSIVDRAKSQAILDTASTVESPSAHSEPASVETESSSSPTPTSTTSTINIVKTPSVPFPDPEALLSTPLPDIFKEFPSFDEWRKKALKNSLSLSVSSISPQPEKSDVSTAATSTSTTPSPESVATSSAELSVNDPSSSIDTAPVNNSSTTSSASQSSSPAGSETTSTVEQLSSSASATTESPSNINIQSTQSFQNASLSISSSATTSNAVSTTESVVTETAASSTVSVPKPSSASISTSTTSSSTESTSVASLTETKESSSSAESSSVSSPQPSSSSSTPSSVETITSSSASVPSTTPITTAVRPTPPTRLHPLTRAPKDRFNYASFDCGAIILSSNPKSQGASNILSENKDNYMLNRCSVKKWVVVELCDDILVDTVVLGNFEFFSSMLKDFKLSVSDRYPPKDPGDGTGGWKQLGLFRGENKRELQVFQVANPLIWARYLRIDFLSHYGHEYYCPISLLRVYGKTMMEEMKEEEERLAKVGSQQQHHQQSLNEEELELLHGDGKSNGLPDDTASSAIDSHPSDSSTSEGMKALHEMKEIMREERALPQHPSQPYPPRHHHHHSHQYTYHPQVIRPGNLDVEWKANVPRHSVVFTDENGVPFDEGSGSEGGEVFDTSPARVPSVNGKSGGSNSNTGGGGNGITPVTELFKRMFWGGSGSGNNNNNVNNNGQSGGNTEEQKQSPAKVVTTVPTPTVTFSDAQNQEPQQQQQQQQQQQPPAQQSPRSTPSQPSPPPYSPIPPPPIPTPQTQESIFKTILKRLSILERNFTLSYQYLEEQSKLLNEVFRNWDAIHKSRFSAIVVELNRTLGYVKETYEDSLRGMVTEISGVKELVRHQVEDVESRVGQLEKTMFALGAIEILVLVGIVVVVVWGKSASKAFGLNLVGNAGTHAPGLRLATQNSNGGSISPIPLPPSLSTFLSSPGISYPLSAALSPFSRSPNKNSSTSVGDNETTSAIVASPSTSSTATTMATMLTHTTSQTLSPSTSSSNFASPTSSASSSRKSSVSTSNSTSTRVVSGGTTRTRSSSFGQRHRRFLYNSAYRQLGKEEQTEVEEHEYSDYNSSIHSGSEEDSGQHDSDDLGHQSHHVPRHVQVLRSQHYLSSPPTPSPPPFRSTPASPLRAAVLADLELVRRGGDGVAFRDAIYEDEDEEELEGGEKSGRVLEELLAAAESKSEDGGDEEEEEKEGEEEIERKRKRILTEIELPFVETVERSAEEKEDEVPDNDMNIPSESQSQSPPPLSTSPRSSSPISPGSSIQIIQKDAKEHRE